MPDTALLTECRAILSRIQGYESIAGVSQARIRGVLHALDAAIGGQEKAEVVQIGLFDAPPTQAALWKQGE